MNFVLSPTLTCKGCGGEFTPHQGMKVTGFRLEKIGTDQQSDDVLMAVECVCSMCEMHLPKPGE